MAGPVSILSDVFEVTPTVLNNDAYDSGDVIFASAEIANVCEMLGGGKVVTLQTIVLNDKDDQKAALTLVFLNRSTALGTADSAPGISDANADQIVGIVDIATGDYKDLGGASVVNLANLGRKMKASSAITSGSLWVNAYTPSSTPTYTTGGLVFKFGFEAG